MSLFIITAIGVFLFGTIIGSFLNVYTLRYNTGRSLSGRSSCPSCTHPLSWAELIPVFSYLLLRGRCKECKSLLSLQYPGVELLTGILFVALFVTTSSLPFFLYSALLFSIYIVIGMYDIRHSIVPNGLAYGVASIAFLGLFFDFHTLSIVLPRLLDLLAGPLVALPLFLLWLVSRGTWMGLGDVKLALSFGWILGISQGLGALLIAIWLGALFGICLIIFSHIQTRRAYSSAGKRQLAMRGSRRTIKSEIAFAPFLLIGFAFVFFFNIGIIELIVW